jgi:hypothetical protein
VDKYFVNFYAYDMNTKQKTLGHVFVGFLQRSGGDIVALAKVGFSPIRGINQEEATKGTVEGTLLDEEGTKHNTAYINEVSFDQYENAIKMKNQWQNQSSFYKLFDRDCLTFAIEVANVIGIKPIPRGIFSPTPDNYIEDIRNEQLDYIKSIMSQ